MKISIVLPCYNEELIIKENVSRVLDFAKKNLSSYDWQLIVADNGSDDNTLGLSQEMASGEPRFKVIHIPLKGRGQALKTSWQKFPAQFYCYMDADLSVDLKALPPLIAAVAKEGFDLAVGSRYCPGAKVNRSIGRDITSYGYNFLIQIILGLKTKDAQCGFKAINNRVLKEIIPQVKNNGWFFDSEILARSERAGYKIKEVPVDWVENRIEERVSKVKVVATIINYIKEMWRLRKELK